MVDKLKQAKLLAALLRAKADLLDLAESEEHLAPAVESVDQAIALLDPSQAESQLSRAHLPRVAVTIDPKSGHLIPLWHGRALYVASDVEITEGGEFVRLSLPLRALSHDWFVSWHLLEAIVQFEEEAKARPAD